MSAIALSVVACGKSDIGSASVTTRGSTAVSSSSAPDSDVHIADQLDTTRFVSAPCSTLTAEQTEQLGISSERNASNGTACTWRFGPNLDWALQIYYVLPDAKNGLQNLYNQKAAGWYDKGYFEPTTIENYPAVFNSGTDLRPQGTCDLSVGVNNEMIMSVTVHGQVGRDNCKATGNAASAAIRTIKAAGR
nr:DUF3558 family protein [Amycolatopsis granulosa]